MGDVDHQMVDQEPLYYSARQDVSTKERGRVCNLTLYVTDLFSYFISGVPWPTLLLYGSIYHPIWTLASLEACSFCYRAINNRNLPHRWESRQLISSDHQLCQNFIFWRSDYFLDLTPDGSERLFGVDNERLIRWKYAGRRMKKYRPQMERLLSPFRMYRCPS